MHINRSVLPKQHRIQWHACHKRRIQFLFSLPRRICWSPHCQNIVNGAAVKRLTHPLPKCSITTGGKGHIRGQ